MLTEEQVKRFHADGFVKGGRVLTDDEVDELRAEMVRVIDERDRKDQPQPVHLANLGTDERPIWQIVNIWQASEPFASLTRNSRITEELAQLTEANSLRMWHDQIQYKPAAQGGLLHWHQDAPLWPILTPMTQVTAWVALDDVDESNGCMSMVRGSHLWGDQIAYLHSIEGEPELPDTFDGHPVEVVMRPVAKGEVHYHHSLTWHGSHANLSTRPRRAIALHVMGDDTRYVASGEHVMKEFVTVGDGEPMTDEAFPVVWQGAV
ncbi:phytanoyl-CoA dioxygenase family protein [Actinopolymorpha alba]|uniref:phytanoyl-CoA dioxygenase family protein n=1 Tax=Actinopolymorpha alba TaxID=533267 RepID=UPI0003717FB3|nr:phytanoyl-CoA dioxygenase family protein [Actinopolymorpha alba]